MIEKLIDAKKAKQLIDEQARLLNEENKHTEEKSSLYCSDAYKCPKKVYFDFKNKDKAEEFPPRILRIFQNGDAVHSRICYYFEKAGELEGTEIDIPKNDYNIRGRIDAMLRDGTIVEIKSINSAFVEEPIKEHVGQLQLYLFLFGNTINGSRKGILIYESKVNNEVFPFDIQLDMNIVNEILEQFKEIQECVLKSTPPERDRFYKKFRYPCKYCQFLKMCYDEKKD